MWKALLILLAVLAVGRPALGEHKSWEQPGAAIYVTAWCKDEADLLKVMDLQRRWVDRDAWASFMQSNTNSCVDIGLFGYPPINGTQIEIVGCIQHPKDPTQRINYNSFRDTKGVIAYSWAAHDGPCVMPINFGIAI